MRVYFAKLAEGAMPSSEVCWEASIKLGVMNEEVMAWRPVARPCLKAVENINLKKEITKVRLPRSTLARSVPHDFIMQEASALIL